MTLTSSYPSGKFRAGNVEKYILTVFNVDCRILRVLSHFWSNNSLGEEDPFSHSS